MSRQRDIDGGIDLPSTTAEYWEWQLRGACRDEGIDPELFFHPWDEPLAQRRIRANVAISICKVCPVVSECLDWSMKVQEPYGTWGGVSEDDRRRMLRLRRVVRG